MVGNVWLSPRGACSLLSSPGPGPGPACTLSAIGAGCAVLAQTCKNVQEDISPAMQRHCSHAAFRSMESCKTSFPSLRAGLENDSPLLSMQGSPGVKTAQFVCSCLSCRREDK